MSTRSQAVPPAFITTLVVLAAILGRLPALGAYWNQDDWGLLAGAMGLDAVAPQPVRWLSRVVYWEIMEPLAGLSPQPYAWTRLALHALAAAGVVQLARRLDLGELRATVAGLVMAASPLAFLPLYWAAGVQDLLAVAAATWALVAWLAPGRAGAVGALLLTAAALASKETVAGLPVVLTALAVWGPTPRRTVLDRTVLAIVFALAAAVLVLAARSFGTGPDEPYALGGPRTAIHHLALYGWWLLQPGPRFSIDPSAALLIIGGALWLVWLGWALQRWRAGTRSPAVSWLGAAVMIAPLLALGPHIAPDLAYPVEPFGCLAIGCLVPRRLPARPVLILVLTVASATWGFLGMEGRLDLRRDDGLPADPLVRRTAASWHATSALDRLPVADRPLVIVQPPLAEETARMASDLGEAWVTGSLLYHALGGALGPRVVLADMFGDDAAPVQWANGLRKTPADALVLVDAGSRWKPWGFTRQALLYQTLTDVGLGHFDRARLHLLRSSLLSGDQLGFLYDPDLLIVPMARVLANKDAFIDHLAAGLRQGRTATEIGGLQTNFFRLLSACTGLDEATLREPGVPTERTPR